MNIYFGGSMGRPLQILTQDFVKMEKNSNPSPEQTLFAETVLEIFTPTFAKYGFIVHSTTIRQYSSTVIFEKDQQSVKVSSSTHPLDYPDSYDIRLGDSGFIWIYLSELQSEADGFKYCEYSFPYKGEFRISISNANEALVKYTEPFLLGDPKFLSEVDARLDRNRPKGDQLPMCTPLKTRKQS